MGVLLMNLPKNRLFLAIMALCLSFTVTSRIFAGDANNCDATKTNCPNANAVGSIYGIEMRALTAQMAAHPVPEVTPVPVDEKLLFSRAYRRVMQETDLYDQPNGKVVGHIDSGFNFVNAGREKDGFIEIRTNQWVQSKVLGPVNKAVSKFGGVTLGNGLPSISFGWVLLDTKPSRTPGAHPISGTPEMKRYTRVNIFATQDIDGWTWYLVGPDQWIVQTRVAVVQPATRPEGISGKWVAVDLYEQTLTAYEDDKAVFATLISSGLPLWSTNEGTFKIYDRHELIKMSGAGGRVDFYFLPEVPYVMYFNDSEQALHGAYWHDGFGFRRSHGCVNMSITDSMWVFKWTSDQPDAVVYVYHSGEYKHGAPR